MAEGLEVTATFRGGYRADVTARGHEVTVDEPVDSGGGDEGFMPTELFCGALASCFCLAIGHVARKRGLDVPGLTVTVRSHRAGRELRYERFTVVSAADVEDGVLAMLVERARPFCWVSNTLAAGVQVEYLHTSRNDRFG
jgi:putative redox protein